MGGVLHPGGEVTWIWFEGINMFYDTSTISVQSGTG